MKRLLIATYNPGKLNEFRLIINDLVSGLEIVSLGDLGVKDKVEETGVIFEENAILKARFYANLVRLPALSDDGGIEIDHLNGEPGVLSRRWPGYEATDEELIVLTLEKLRGVPLEKRGAQLRAVLALATPGESQVPVFEGILRGYITETPRAPIIPGFPFRSIFFVPERGRVLAELSPEEEASLSHRRTALEKAKPLLEAL